MKQLKQALAVLAVIIGTSFFLFNPLQVAADSPPIGLIINGQAVTNMPTPPMIQQDSTLVPARAVFQTGLGAIVDWDEATRTVYIQYGNRRIILLIGSKALIVNGYLTAMPIPAQIINGNTMIPLRAVAENLGFEVDFRDRTIFIDNIAGTPPDNILPTTPQPPTNTPFPTPQPPSNTHSTNPPRDVSTTVIPPMALHTTSILSVSAPPRNTQQIFTITASSPIPGVESFLLYGNRLVINFPNSRTNLNGNISVPYYSSALEVRASQFSADTSRVVFVLPDGIEFSIRITDDRLHVLVTLYAGADLGTNNNTGTYNNSGSNDEPGTNINNHPPVVGVNTRIRYENGVIRIPRATGFSMNTAAHNNVYRHQRYILTLPVDASGVLGVGSVTVSSPMLYSFSIGRNWQGHTYLTLTGRQILSVRIIETNDYYHISIMSPRERYQRIVVIDPGHGGQPGAVYNDIRAANLNLAISRKLVQLIQECGFMQVFTTRCEDMFVSLQDRAQFANDIGDMMVTIHHNAWYNTAVTGVETFYRPNGFDERRALTSQNLAEIVLRQAVAHTGRNNRGYREANFAVLRYSQIPSTLIEVGFMSNPQEFAELISAEYQWRVARAIFEGLREAFMMYTPDRPLG